MLNHILDSNDPNKDCRKWSTVYSDLGINRKFLSIKSYSEFPKSYNLKGNRNTNKNKLRLTNGQKYFLIKELEVFRVNLLT